jgi:hypothetical protein
MKKTGNISVNNSIFIHIIMVNVKKVLTCYKQIKVEKL